VIAMKPLSSFNKFCSSLKYPASLLLSYQIRLYARL
jgi:hypothetical protein